MTPEQIDVLWDRFYNDPEAAHLTTEEATALFASLTAAYALASLAPEPDDSPTDGGT